MPRQRLLKCRVDICFFGNSAVSLLDILYYPDSQLRRSATEVVAVDGKVAHLVDQMLETMYAAPGIGLAATQVDVHQRVVVIDVSDNSDKPLTFINPVLLETDGEAEMQEGCLSIPGVYETIKRPSQVRVSALDREGNPFEMDADGLLAVCIQHEIDHLNGKLFVDYLSPLKRNRIRKRMEKWIRDGADPDDLPERPER
jgi:peptide deformylase